MIEIRDKKECTGCGACVNACPTQIISLCEDIEGFTYPEVDTSKCIECHLCERVCPMLDKQKMLCHKIDGFPQFYSGQLMCKNDLMEVSSGGAFWAFAQTVIEQGGVVYGAEQTEVDVISHTRVDNIEDAKRLRRSKYFQSNTGFTFRQVKEDLKTGKMILYSGTGCQIAGLKSYLGKRYDNLYTCEVVCHGVPSRIVWKAYRKEKEEREGKRITDLVFRDKSAGWSKNQYKITYQDGTIEKEASTKQLFHAGYLRGLFYRPSCGSCRFASIPREADITLADYWKYQGRFHSAEKDMGVSLIVINSEQGRLLLQKSSVFLEYDKTDEELAKYSCKHLDEHPFENPERAAFFDLFFKNGYYAAAEKYIVSNMNRGMFMRIAQKMKKLFRLK